MRLLIHAPAARMGGALSHLLGLVPELAALAPEDEVRLIAQPELIQMFPPLPATWELVPERAQTRGLAHRLLWEQYALPQLARQWQADVLLSFGSFVPLRLQCASVAEAGNALPFTRQYWLKMRAMPLWVRALEVARWLLLQASLRAASRVLVPSRAMRQDVVNRLPELGRRVDVALWGVAPLFHQRRWRPKNGQTVLGVSKHGINKEFDVLLLAMADVVERFPAARLLLTGTPNESPWARRTVELARSLHLEQRIEFVGDVPNPCVADLIAESDLLVFPTWCESFGLPLAEALAIGAPAVAADIPACREIGQEAARFYRPGDPQSLAAQICTLLGNPTAAVTLGNAARERGRVFSWRTNARQVRNTLVRAIEQQEGTHSR